MADTAASTADAAFVTDAGGTILAWNAAAERLLGYDQRRALGALCYRLLGGIDLYGNRFCNANCSVVQMAVRHETLHPFAANLRRDDGCTLCVRVSPMVLPVAGSTGPAILHVLEPCHGCGQATWGDDLDSGLDENTGVPAHLADPSGLTARELEVLQLIADGRSTPEIAGELFISVATVRNHVQRILAKLSAHTRLGAVCVARRSGIL